MSLLTLQGGQWHDLDSTALSLEIQQLLMRPLASGKMAFTPKSTLLTLVMKDSKIIKHKLIHELE